MGEKFIERLSKSSIFANGCSISLTVSQKYSQNIFAYVIQINLNLIRKTSIEVKGKISTLSKS